MIDRALTYSLVGYAVMSCTSIAGASIFIVLSTIFAILKIIKERRILPIAEPKILVGFALLILAVALSAIFSPDKANSFDKTVAYLSRAVLMFIVIFCVKDKSSLVLFVLGIVFSITASDIIAIWQGIHGNMRASGIGKSAMILAGYLAQVIGILLVLAMHKDKPFVRYRWLFALSFFLSLVALYYNGTRGAWLAAVIVVMLYFSLCIRSVKVWFTAAFLILCSLSLFFVINPYFHDRLISIANLSYGSNFERLLLWKASWQMFLDHPVVGIGVGNFLHDYNAYYLSPLSHEYGLGHAHNNFLQMLADTGFVGFFAFMYFYYLIFSLSYRNFKRNGSIYSIILIVATTGLLAQGLTEFNFGDSAVIRLFWFLTGIAFSAGAYESNRKGVSKGAA